MVTDNHYRWDFIMLSTDVKPTPATSKKVTNGSTLYTSDDSKLYVWYKDQWYEKTATGGGGGTTYTAGDGIVIDNDEISVDLTQSTGSSSTSVMSQKAVTDALASAGGGITKLTSADYNWNSSTWQAENPNAIALWLLDEGFYTTDNSALIYVNNSTSVQNTAVEGNIIYVSHKYAQLSSAAGTLVSITFFGGRFADGLPAGKTFVTDSAQGYDAPFIPGHVSNVLSSANLKQSTGASTTDVMSQKASTDMVYSPKQTSTYNNWGAVYIGNKDNNNNVIVDPSASDTHATYFYALPYNNTVPKSRGVNILGAITDGQGNVSIGQGAHTNKNGGIALGFTTQGTGTGSIGIGASADTDGKNYSIALGYAAKPTRNGEMNIGSGATNAGYNSTSYRVLGGVHDPVDNHDAATKGYVDPTTDASAPTTATVGRVGQIFVDTTNATAYMCVAADDVTPAYTWKQITA